MPWQPPTIRLCYIFSLCYTLRLQTKWLDIRNEQGFHAVACTQTFSFRVYLDLTVFDEHFMNTLEISVVEPRRKADAVRKPELHQ